MATQASAVKAGGPAQSQRRQRCDENRRSRPPARSQDPGLRVLETMHPTRPSYPTHHFFEHDPIGKPVPTFPDHAREPVFRLSLVLAHPRSGPDRGQTIPRPLPLQADGLAVLKPFWELPAGKRNTSAPNRERLGHLRCARQELVRLSESNTKYDGKLGTTGAYAAPVTLPSIGESKRIPKLKKSCSWAPATLTPALHRQPPCSPSRACAGATHGCLRKAAVWHARPRLARCRPAG